MQGNIVFLLEGYRTGFNVKRFGDLKNYFTAMPTKRFVRNGTTQFAPNLFEMEWLQVLGLNNTMQYYNRIKYSLNTMQLFVSHRANHGLLTPWYNTGA